MSDRATNTNSQETNSTVSMMTKQDICAEARVSLSYVNKILASGDLRHVKLGRAVRIKRSDWISFVETSLRRRA